MPEPAIYEWSIQVVHWNEYGDRVLSHTPATIIAATRAQVTEKVRAAWDARYDDFRKFWSHGWEIVSVRELSPNPLANLPEPQWDKIEKGADNA